MSHPVWCNNSRPGGEERRTVALRHSRERVRTLPEEMKNFLRVRLVAGDALDTILSKSTGKGHPPITVSDLMWFRDTDPVVRAAYFEISMELEDRAHHPLAGMIGRLEFLLRRFEQLEQMTAGSLDPEGRRGITSLRPSEEKALWDAQLDIIRRVRTLVDDEPHEVPLQEHIRAWIEKNGGRPPGHGNAYGEDRGALHTALPAVPMQQRVRAWLENNLDWLPGDDNSYVEDRDVLQAAVQGEYRSAFIPISHLRIIQDIEREFPEQARLLKAAILAAAVPENGLWALHSDAESYSERVPLSPLAAAATGNADIEHAETKKAKRKRRRGQPASSPADAAVAAEAPARAPQQTEHEAGSGPCPEAGDNLMPEFASGQLGGHEEMEELENDQLDDMAEWEDWEKAASRTVTIQLSDRRYITYGPTGPPRTYYV